MYHITDSPKTRSSTCARWYMQMKRTVTSIRGRHPLGLYKSVIIVPAREDEGGLEDRIPVGCWPGRSRGILVDQVIDAAGGQGAAQAGDVGLGRT
jgi:hypothetical protein